MKKLIPFIVSAMLASPALAQVPAEQVAFDPSACRNPHADIVIMIRGKILGQDDAVTEALDCPRVAGWR